MGGDFCICQVCRERVDVSDPEVVRARHRIVAQSSGSTEIVDGPGVHFHGRCYSELGSLGRSRYRLVEDAE
ncbi:MAG TPA: hypothetical protein VFH66_12060 [Mycobacteriales bacterium]|nr:hypothetical protein [Mycobacteriales bacterium]